MLPKFKTRLLQATPLSVNLFSTHILPTHPPSLPTHTHTHIQKGWDWLTTLIDSIMCPQARSRMASDSSIGMHSMLEDMKKSSEHLSPMQAFEYYLRTSPSKMKRINQVQEDMGYRKQWTQSSSSKGRWQINSKTQEWLVYIYQAQKRCLQRKRSLDRKPDRTAHLWGGGVDIFIMYNKNKIKWNKDFIYNI